MQDRTQKDFKTRGVEALANILLTEEETLLKEKIKAVQHLQAKMTTNNLALTDLDKIVDLHKTLLASKKIQPNHPFTKLARWAEKKMKAIESTNASQFGEYPSDIKNLFTEQMDLTSLRALRTTGRFFHKSRELQDAINKLPPTMIVGNDTIILVSPDKKSILIKGYGPKSNIIANSQDEKLPYSIYPVFCQLALPEGFTISQVFIQPHNYSEACQPCGHIMLLSDSGELFGWGEQYHGEMGIFSDGMNYELFLPHFVQLTPLKVDKVVSGQNFTLICSAGQWYGCGLNAHHPIPSLPPTIIKGFTPFQFPETIDVKQVAAGSNHLFVLDKNGSVYGCGFNRFNQLGLPSNTVTELTLINFPGLAEDDFVEEIQTRYSFSLFRTKNNQYYYTGVLRYSNFNSPKGVFKATFLSNHSVLQMHLGDTRLLAQFNNRWHEIYTTRTGDLIEQPLELPSDGEQFAYTNAPVVLRRNCDLVEGTTTISDVRTLFGAQQTPQIEEAFATETPLTRKP